MEYLQAVHNCAAFPAVVFLLPLVHLADELQEGALGHGCVPVHWPAQELELLNHPMPILGLQRERRQSGMEETASLTLLNSGARFLPLDLPSHQSKVLARKPSI